MKRFRLLTGDCIEVMRRLEDASVDSIVTDPPYGLGFMGKQWDELPPGLEWAQECLRVLKPGGHLLAFGGSRTYHRLAAAVEDAGFEIRDQIMWLYGSGFPKSLDVSKAIDKAAGAEREVVGRRTTGLGTGKGATPIMGDSDNKDLTAPATPQAAQWDGWGTALKPAHEPIVVARKPLIGTVAANVLEHGTGAINVDGCRVGSDTIQGGRSGRQSGSTFNASIGDQQKPHEGRWPANIILNKEAGEMLDEQQEGASRFFYCPKASKKERSAGTNKNIHPTVKPVELMRYLCRLVTPPGGVILDPFLGSGSTGCAVAAENNEQNPDWGFIGIEREAEYMDIAKARIKHWRNLKPDAKPDSPAKPVQQMQLGEEVQS